MRRRLLLPLLVALVACMGSECSDSSSHSSSSSSGVSAFEIDEPGDAIAAPVPEPSAMLVFGVGLAIAGAALRRQRKR